MVGASAHPVALDNVEVLEIDQVAWSLLIIGDLDTYFQPVTQPGLLPTGSTKSPLSAALGGCCQVVFEASGVDEAADGVVREVTESQGDAA